jgi:hypothetical protein
VHEQRRRERRERDDMNMNDVKDFIRKSVHHNRVIDLRMLKAAAIMMGAIEIGQWTANDGSKHSTLFWPDNGRDKGGFLDGAELRCVMPPKDKAMDAQTERAILEKRIKYNEAVAGVGPF